MAALKPTPVMSALVNFTPWMVAFKKFESVRTESVKSALEALAPENPVEVTMAPVMLTCPSEASPKEASLASMPAIEAPTK